MTMKKKEAEEIAVNVSRVIMEYITNILTDNQKVEGTIDFVSGKVEGYQEKMCVVVISVPDKPFYKPINSGIPSTHSIPFYTRVLEDIADTCLYQDDLSISRFYSIKEMMGPVFKGIDAKSTFGNRIRINFSNIGTELNEAIDVYNKKIDLYESDIKKGNEKENFLESGKVK